MVQFLSLVLWMSSGVIVAAAAPNPGHSRLAWAPVALILGPLWFAVAIEHRGSAV